VQKFGQGAGLANPCLEREQTAGMEIGRRRFDQLANEFIAPIAGKKGNFRIAQDFRRQLIAIES